MSYYSFVAPILPGGEEKIRRFIRDEDTNNPEHDRAMHSAGIYSERLWLQRTPMGDFIVAVLETEDTEKALRSMATSNDPWVVRFRNFIKEVHGIDLTKPAPLNEMLEEWEASEKSRVLQNKNVMK